MATPESFVTSSEQETYAVAERLAPTLAAGSYVLLQGDLGAGKTAFVRGLAAGLGADPLEVSSPTFVLIQHYKGRMPLIHVDLYRLDTGAAVDDLGLEEMAEGGIVAIEWSERLPRSLGESIAVRIADLGGNSRRITISRGEHPGYSDR